MEKLLRFEPFIRDRDAAGDSLSEIAHALWIEHGLRASTQKISRVLGRERLSSAKRFLVRHADLIRQGLEDGMSFAAIAEKVKAETGRAVAVSSVRRFVLDLDRILEQEGRRAEVLQKISRLTSGAPSGAPRSNRPAVSTKQAATHSNNSDPAPVAVPEVKESGPANQGWLAQLQAREQAARQSEIPNVPVRKWMDHTPDEPKGKP